jgi:outer membrane immunogenic protein
MHTRGLGIFCNAGLPCDSFLDGGEIMKKVLLATTAIVALACGSAKAADLGMPMKAPPPPPPPPTWTGCYVGVNGGWGWARSDFTAEPGFPTATPPFGTIGGPPGFEVSKDLSGGIFGGHVGCQYQWANFVFGVEASADWTDIRGSTTAAPVFPPFTELEPTSFDTRVKWLATATPRLGWAWGSWMYYVKGGLAAAQDDLTITRLQGNPFFIGDSFSVTESRIGWTVGTGFEWMFAPGWIVGVEYNFVDLGRDLHSGIGSGGTDVGFFSEDHRLTINEVLGRVSYKFGWGGGPGGY